MRSSSAGFTLVELMVSISIMLIIMVTVVFRFNSFDSTILLKTLTYDVALSVRTAQTYSVSVFGTSGEFRKPYGLSFAPDATEYYLFAYDDSDRPHYLANSEIDTYQLGRSYEVTDVCVVDSGGTDCDIDRLDISFRRPEYVALFYADGYSEVQNGNIQSATIKLQSTKDPALTGVVEVGYAGGVTVSLEETGG